MKLLVNISRYLLGAMFLIFGLNVFFHFLPMPTPPEAAGAFLGALFSTGYFFQMLGLVYVVSAILLLANSFVPLALLFLIAPIVNIIIFHLYLDPAGIGPGMIALVLELLLAWGYRDSFATVVSRKHNISG